MATLEDWVARPAPTFPKTVGHFVELEIFSPDRDGEALFAAIGGAENDDLWQFIPFGPLDSAEALTSLLGFVRDSDAWQTLVLRDRVTSRALGMASYMRVRPGAGSAEVGAVVFSKALQRTPAATEAVFQMARYLFDELGYRRFEWKCDDANAASRRAALRFGFTEEGVFRQDLVVKGRNRDTAWFSMLDAEWPYLRAAFEGWLAPTNFDGDGHQRRTLESFRVAPA